MQNGKERMQNEQNAKRCNSLQNVSLRDLGEGVGGGSRQVPGPVMVWQEVAARFAAVDVHIAACQRAETAVLAEHKNPIQHETA